jgi:hypothetical protein
MINEIRGFWGDPTVLADWDTNGAGVAGGEYDGWQLCNGLNGSPNFTDRFVIAGHMDNSAGHIAYSGGWQTFVDTISDLKTGGAPSTLITQAHLPELSVPAIPAQTISLDVTGNEYKSDATNSPAAFLIDVHYANLLPHTGHIATINIPAVPAIHYGASVTGTPAVAQANFPTLPPFLVMGWMIFVGYGGTPSV